MEEKLSKKFNKLDHILEGLDSATLSETVTKTVSIRLPVHDLAIIDVFAQMKDMSRNVFLNDIIGASLGELMEKLEDKNKLLAQEVTQKAEVLAQRMLQEPEPPHHKGPGPKKHKKKPE